MCLPFYIANVPSTRTRYSYGCLPHTVCPTINIRSWHTYLRVCARTHTQVYYRQLYNTPLAMAQCAHRLPLGPILFDCALKQLQMAIDSADHVHAAKIQPTVSHTRTSTVCMCLQLGVCILAVHCQPGACVAMLEHGRFGALITEYVLHVHDDTSVSDVQQRVYAVLQLLCTNVLFASCVEHKFAVSTAIKEVCVRHSAPPLPCRMCSVYVRTLHKAMVNWY